jgi:hypothetical protein
MAALQLRRGLRANLPAIAAVGEPLIATDTRELFVGTGTSTYKIGDIIFAAVAPTITVEHAEKIWINTATNIIYRVEVGAWVAITSIDVPPDLTGLIPKTDIATATDLGGVGAADTKVPSQLAVKTYVDNTVSAIKIPNEWPNSVLDQLTTPPGTPAVGARYIVKATATDAWLGLENQIVEWNGAGWSATAPAMGSFISIDADTTGLYYYGGTGWVKKDFELTTAGPGLEVNAGQMTVNPTLAGDGLVWNATTGVLSIGVIDGGTF